MEGNDARGREKWLEEGRNGWCKGGGGELQMQADGEGEMNGIQSTEGGVAFERGGDTSSIETRGETEKLGSQERLFSMEI